MDLLPQLYVLGHVALAGALGGLVGLEREQANKPAGLRTHMLVAAAAAMLMELGEIIVLHFRDFESSLVTADPIRIMQAIIVGVSFLGAGTIITNNSEERVEGLTTAASVLLSTALGIAAAMGQYVLAIGAAVLTVGVLRGVKVMEGRVNARAAADRQWRRDE